MQRAMAAQAEAERERRAKIISAEQISYKIEKYIKAISSTNSLTAPKVSPVIPPIFLEIYFEIR